MSDEWHTVSRTRLPATAPSSSSFVRRTFAATFHSTAQQPQHKHHTTNSRPATATATVALTAVATVAKAAPHPPPAASSSAKPKAPSKPQAVARASFSVLLGLDEEDVNDLIATSTATAKSRDASHDGVEHAAPSDENSAEVVNAAPQRLVYDKEMLLSLRFTPATASIPDTIPNSILQADPTAAAHPVVDGPVAPAKHRGGRRSRQKRSTSLGSSSSSAAPALSSSLALLSSSAHNDREAMVSTMLRSSSSVASSATEAAAATPTPAAPAEQERMSDEMHDSIKRSLLGLLNRITVDNYVRLSDVIKETLDAVVERSATHSVEALDITSRLVYEKAVLEPKFGFIYADLCVKLATITCFVRTHDGGNAEDSKGTTFRSLLLNRCQAGFELTDEPDSSSSSASSSSSSADDVAAEEQDARRKSKRIGNAKFIAELRKKRLLPDAIITLCIDELLNTNANANAATAAQDGEHGMDTEDLEVLLVLLSSIGETLEAQGGTAATERYFQRLTELAADKRFEFRLRSLARDLIELRERNWVPRTAASKPHATTAAATAVVASHQPRKLASSVPPPSFHSAAAVAAPPPPPRAWMATRSQHAPAAPLHDTATDMAAVPVPLAPTAVPMPSLKVKGLRSGLVPSVASLPNVRITPSSPNSTSPSRPSSPVASPSAATAVSPSRSTGAGAGAVSAEVEKRLRNKLAGLIEELFSLRDLDEAVECWKELEVPSEPLLIKLLLRSLVHSFEAKESERVVLVRFFGALERAGEVTTRQIKRAFLRAMADLPDLLLDSPRASQHLAQLLCELVNNALISAAEARFIAEAAPSDELMAPILSAMVSCCGSSNANANATNLTPLIDTKSLTSFMLLRTSQG